MACAGDVGEYESRENRFQRHELAQVTNYNAQTLQVLALIGASIASNTIGDTVDVVSGVSSLMRGDGVGAAIEFGSLLVPVSIPYVNDLVCGGRRMVGDAVEFTNRGYDYLRGMVRKLDQEIDEFGQAVGRGSGLVPQTAGVGRGGNRVGHAVDDVDLGAVRFASGGGGFGLELNRVEYGASEISQVIQDFRVNQATKFDPTFRNRGNVAAFRIDGEIPQSLIDEIVAYPGWFQRHNDWIIARNSGQLQHSERILHNLLEHHNISHTRVLEVYSELSPCSGSNIGMSCLRLLESNLYRGDIKITFSFEHPTEVKHFHQTVLNNLHNR